MKREVSIDHLVNYGPVRFDLPKGDAAKHANAARYLNLAQFISIQEQQRPAFFSRQELMRLKAAAGL